MSLFFAKEFDLLEEYIFFDKINKTSDVSFAMSYTSLS